MKYCEHEIGKRTFQAKEPEDKDKNTLSLQIMPGKAILFMNSLLMEDRRKRAGSSNYFLIEID